MYERFFPGEHDAAEAFGDRAAGAAVSMAGVQVSVAAGIHCCC
jgi:hypothetical protein